MITEKTNLINQVELIKSLYNVDKKSIRAIAKELNCSFSGIKRILHKMEIPRRNKCESLNLCPSNFTQKEKSIILGSVLGDGHIAKKRGQNGESQVILGHSPKQKEYIEYKYNELKRFIGCKIYPLQHKIGNKVYTTLNFLTRKDKKFTFYRNLFYNEFKKVIPIDYIKENIDPLALAVWFMDDGYNYPNKGCEFCSESFTEEENRSLTEMLQSCFGITSHLTRVRKNQYRIYVKKADKVKLFNIISNYVVPSMKYKIKILRDYTLNGGNSEDIVRSAWKHAEGHEAPALRI